MNLKAAIRKAISSVNTKLRMNRLLEIFKADRFSVISWGATVLLVVALLGSTLWWT